MNSPLLVKSKAFALRILNETVVDRFDQYC